MGLHMKKMGRKIHEKISSVHSPTNNKDSRLQNRVVEYEKEIRFYTFNTWLFNSYYLLLRHFRSLLECKLAKQCRKWNEVEEFGHHKVSMKTEAQRGRLLFGTQILNLSSH